MHKFFKVLFTTSLSFALTVQVANAASSVDLQSSTWDAPIAANGSSISPDLSGDGTTLVFSSTATNLKPNTFSSFEQIYSKPPLSSFKHDLISSNPDGTPGDGDSRNPAVSADGHYIVFASTATNIANDSDSGPAYSDIFIYDRESGQRALVSTDQDTVNWDPDVVADGDSIYITWRAGVFEDSNSNNPFVDRIFIKKIPKGNLSGGTILELTKPYTADVDANDHSADPSIAYSGDLNRVYVAFSTEATNLVANDQNGSTSDVVLTTLNSADLVPLNQRFTSVSGDGSQGGRNSYRPDLSVHKFESSGEIKLGVVYQSASTLDDEDTNSQQDVFYTDYILSEAVKPQLQDTKLLSRGKDGNSAKGQSTLARVSPSLSQATFVSSANNIVTGDTEGKTDVFKISIRSGVVQRISQGGGGGNADSSGPAPVTAVGVDSLVAFPTLASNLDEEASDSNNESDVYIYLSSTPSTTTPPAVAAPPADTPPADSPPAGDTDGGTTGDGLNSGSKSGSGQGTSASSDGSFGGQNSQNIVPASCNSSKYRNGLRIRRSVKVSALLKRNGVPIRVWASHDSKASLRVRILKSDAKKWKLLSGSRKHPTKVLASVKLNLKASKKQTVKLKARGKIKKMLQRAIKRGTGLTKAKLRVTLSTTPTADKSIKLINTARFKGIRRGKVQTKRSLNKTKAVTHTFACDTGADGSSLQQDIASGRDLNSLLESLGVRS